ncbi:MAG TPA: NADH-quinone oxidoreductase subunit NuoB [Victivallales bacterium]|nr:NADH-quinone oxidoreductase subunit NuoB [Victivallales bacterium]
MIRVLKSRMKQGYRTFKFPDPNFPMPERFTGRPSIEPKCSQCMKCLELCPVSCIERSGKSVAIDIGSCIFCGKCEKICPDKTIKFSDDYSLCANSRGDLKINSEVNSKGFVLNKKIKELFGRSLKLRQVCAGGCNACEADTNVLGTIGWDLGRFGIQFVASPRHADGILVTGPISGNMSLAIKKTYDAVPSPKLVIAVGACAISGGIFMGNPETCAGVEKFFPVDVFIPGCPPHPATILDGLLRLIGRIEKE